MVPGPGQSLVSSARLAGRSQLHPTNAINQLEMFQADTFDPRRIDTELGWAGFYGLNTARVFLHDQLWAQDQRGFQRRLAQFVDIAAPTASNHCSSSSLVLGSGAQGGSAARANARLHNSGWAQSPGAERLGDPRYTRVCRTMSPGC